MPGVLPFGEYSIKLTAKGKSYPGMPYYFTDFGAYEGKVTIDGSTGSIIEPPQHLPDPKPTAKIVGTVSRVDGKPYDFEGQYITLYAEGQGNGYSAEAQIKSDNTYEINTLPDCDCSLSIKSYGGYIPLSINTKVTAAELAVGTVTRNIEIEYGTGQTLNIAPALSMKDNSPVNEEYLKRVQRALTAKLSIKELVGQEYCNWDEREPVQYALNGHAGQYGGQNRATISAIGAKPEAERYVTLDVSLNSQNYDGIRSWIYLGSLKYDMLVGEMTKKYS